MLEIGEMSGRIGGRYPIKGESHPLDELAIPWWRPVGAAQILQQQHRTLRVVVEPKKRRSEVEVASRIEARLVGNRTPGVVVAPDLGEAAVAVGKGHHPALGPGVPAHRSESAHHLPAGKGGDP
jgi:hypothetical protein